MGMPARVQARCTVQGYLYESNYCSLAVYHLCYGGYTELRHRNAYNCLLMDTLAVFRLGGQSKSACRLATTAGLLFTISALKGAADTQLQPHLTSETLSSCLHKCLWVQARCTVQCGWYESISLSVSVRA